MASKSLVSVDKFLASVRSSFKYKDTNKIKLAGFRELMRSQDKLYVFDENEYVKALDKYLGK